MIFDTKEDIEAPLDHVFGVITDFDSFERQALRRGAEVTRLDALTSKGVGMAWNIGFRMRGKDRKLHAEVTEYDTPNRTVIESRSPGLDGQLVAELVALSRNRTRLSLSIELKPQNLSARLLVQSLKLARGNLNKRFMVRVAEFAKDTEDRYQRMA